MESEKVKEIKKALECCRHSIKDGCEPCPYHNPNEDCQEILIWKMEDYINELESENERIKNIGLNEEITVGEYLREMQRLKDKVAELEKENVCEHCQRVILGKEVYCLDCLNKFREISLKSFAERLKEKLGSVDLIRGWTVKIFIDKTLKEFINNKGDEER